MLLRETGHVETCQCAEMGRQRRAPSDAQRPNRRLELTDVLAKMKEKVEAEEGSDIFVRSPYSL